MDEMKTCSPEVASEICRQAELYISSQLTSAIAADQRATNLVSSMTAISLAVISGGLSMLFVENINIPLSFGAISTGLMILVSVICFIKSIQPVSFHYPGSHPTTWIDLDLNKDELAGAILGHSENLQKGIEKNDNTMKDNAKWLRIGMRLIYSAVPVGITISAVAYIFKFCVSK